MANRSSGEQQVEVGGNMIRVTNLDKVIYPATGTTKGEVIGYYSAIAATMLPYLDGRPATRKRWPDGVGKAGDAASFFQKDLGAGAPDWVTTGVIEHKDHANTYPVVSEEATLVWLAQLASLEVHVPQWRFGDTPHVDLSEAQYPDRMVFDLDPGEGVTLVECAKVAYAVRDILRGMDLTVVPVTSGSKGIHLYASLDGRWNSDQVSAVAKRLARELEADRPEEVTSRMTRSLRPGKVFIDWSQNNAAKTTVAPYSLRGRVRPTVAAPRTWRELASPHLKQLEFHEVLRRVERRGDPMRELLASGDETDAEGSPSTERYVQRASQPRDRLTVYRTKRDSRKTPEPVPVPGTMTAKGTRDRVDGSPLPVFVIQRHDARRLHWDFRLEHDGVLVSWALPKGPPADPKVNHLAVPTEDHPMEYRHFAGTIPKGEYGAGKVEIWDSGTYELEKWREDEVIATLHGRAGGGLGGTRRFALFRTGEAGGKPRWMIHLMAPAKVTGPKRQLQVPAIPLAPMLAQAGRLIDGRLPELDPQEWAFEMKWDGIRALALIDGEVCALRSRSGGDLTRAYPELAGLPEAVHADEAVLDGEIVTLGESGAPSFARLQRRFGLSSARDIARARREAPVVFMVFDVLQLSGRDCRALAYRDRRSLLTDLYDEGSDVPIAVPPAFDGSAVDAQASSQELGLEGIVAKRLLSPYRSGERSEDWVKYPLIHTSEAVILGWRESASDTQGFASLLLAEPARNYGNGNSTGNASAWSYAGRVGTGFSAAERRRIRSVLAPLRDERPAAAVPAEIRRDAHWVRPELVCEITSKGRTESGAFRQPVWRGLRPDKTAEALNDAGVTGRGR